MISEFRDLIEQMRKDSTLEAEYQEHINQNPALVTEYLIQTISESPNSELSNYSIILLCRLILVLSENFFSIGDQEFYENVTRNIFNFLGNSDFSSYSLSLISDLVSRIILIYSYSEEFDTNELFFPYISEIIQSQNIDNSHAAINALVYCIYNESIDYSQFLNPISDLLKDALTTEDLNPNILLPCLRLLYLTFDSILFDFSSFIPEIFNQLKSNIGLLNQSIHDIITYLPFENYSFFNNCTNTFIDFFSEILGAEDLPVDLEYCTLEIVYNFSRAFYSDFSTKCQDVISNIFIFLSNYEIDSNESKYIISSISDKYGAIFTFAERCYDILSEVLGKDYSEFPNKQIAAMKLFAYCYQGNAVHLTINMPDAFFNTIIQSGVMESPNQLVRIVAFNMLSSLFKVLATNLNSFQPIIIFQEIIDSIDAPDDPIVLASKLKAFKYYLKCFDEGDLELIFTNMEEKILELAQNSIPEQLIHILGCIEVFLYRLKTANFDNIIEYFLDILKNPNSVPFNIYCMILQSSTYLADIPSEAIYAAFSNIFDLDFEKITEKDLNSLSISIYRTCANFPSYALTLFPLFFQFSIRGAMNDIEYTEIPFQELSSMMNIYVSVEKRNSIIKSYDGSQIQFIIFFLKVLRYSLSIDLKKLSEMEEDIEPYYNLIQEHAENIYNILLKWTSIDFSDKIQYNALKIVHRFLDFTKYEFPFEPLLEQMMKFTMDENEDSRLITLYYSISRIFCDIFSNGKMSDEIMAIVPEFYLNELEKEIQRRDKISEQIQLGDCGINTNDVNSLENALYLILFPFILNPSIEPSFFAEIIEFSIENINVSSIDFIGNYIKFKEPKIEFVDYLYSIFIASSDEEEIEKCNNHFYSLDSKFAALFLIDFIYYKTLNPTKIAALIGIFAQRTKISINCSLFITIVILIADKYSDSFDCIEVLSLLNKADNLFYFDNVKIKYLIESWNNIFPKISKLSFDTNFLARLLGILNYLKEVMDENTAERQRILLLQSFQFDQGELFQIIEDFINMKTKALLMDGLF